jgi:hypothetical protein
MTDLPELSVVYQPIGNLEIYSHNARTHSKHQIRQIASSIKTFGFTNPILIDRNNTIIAGHGRVESARLLGIEQVPTIRLESLTETQIRAYVLADNRLAEKAGWEKSILAIELQHLLTVNSDLDVTVTGFEIPEIDLILSQAAVEPDPDDTFEIAHTGPAVTQVGDLWLMAKHRVLCDTSLEETSYKSLMNSRRASVVFADPPYNVPVVRRGRWKSRFRTYGEDAKLIVACPKTLVAQNPHFSTPQNAQPIGDAT